MMPSEMSNDVLVDQSQKKGSSALVQALGEREKHESAAEWLEAILLATDGESLKGADVETLATRLHESSGAAPLPDEPGINFCNSSVLADSRRSTIQRICTWRFLPSTPTIITMESTRAVPSRRLLTLVRKQPALISKTGLYGELYDTAKASGPAVWTRLRLLSVLAHADESKFSDLESLVDDISEVIDELASFGKTS